MRGLINVDVIDAVIFSISYFLLGIFLQVISCYLLMKIHKNKNSNKYSGKFGITEITSWAVLWPLLLLLVVSEQVRKFRRKNSPPCSVDQ